MNISLIGPAVKIFSTPPVRARNRGSRNVYLTNSIFLNIIQRYA